jgi:polyhydroxyalkanoate synthesis regulator phasin
MQSPEDDFPYASEDPSLTPIELPAGGTELTSQQASDLKSTLRLLIGSTLNGRDLFVNRLRKMQASQETFKPENVVIDENETALDQLRYLLLGILFEAPDVFQRGLERTGKATDRVFVFFSKLFSPFAGLGAINPVKEQYANAAARGEQVIDRLMMKGRLEEQNSRQMLQEKAIDDLLNEFVEYLVLKTEVRRIIQEEGVSVAGDVAGEFQEESAAVDNLLEQKLRSIFKRNPPTDPVNPMNDQTGEVKAK